METSMQLIYKIVIGLEKYDRIRPGIYYFKNIKIM